MSHPSLPDPGTPYDPPGVVEGELIDLDALVRNASTPLRFPLAVREAAAAAMLPAVAWVPVLEPEHDPRCRCGNVTERGHGGFSCGEVLAIRARVEHHSRMSAWRRFVFTVTGHGGRP